MISRFEGSAMPTRFRSIAAGVLAAMVFGAAPAARSGAAAPEFANLRWRLVGPFRGGRTLAAAGIAGDPATFYTGAVGGGVWKTENAGRTWEPIMDGQPVASIGALAIAPSDPRVVYVGSGEADMRSDISYGNGMYRSSDAGKTWKRIGLADTRQIGRILVDPGNANRVFVAALGHGYGPNAERGVFRSTDGGASWSKVLYRDADTGAIDLAFQPGNPSTILAALWQTRRPPWNAYPPSNGPGSGLYRSEDGGDTWHPSGAGLPTEKLGRIGIAFAPGDPRRVYAAVDAKEGGLFGSDDAGLHWTRASSDKRVWDRGWYFGDLAVDPKNADVVYACNTSVYRSTDGGRTFVPFKGAPGGDDYHQLWIDPTEAKRMILASDQGTAVSLDGGRAWSSWYNQPTAQIYHVVTDDRFPYWIYGAQQDSGAAAVPSRTDYRSITLRDWRPIAGGGESGMIAPDPKDPRVIFGGTVGRFDWMTLQEQDVNPTFAYPGEYRGEWTLPLAFSPKNPAALYFGNQFLFRTVDGGKHWEKVSPDLTREAPKVPATLDPPTAEDSPVKGARRGVLWSIAPSSLDEGRIWCGTNDGAIHLTLDGGRTWRDVTPRDLPAWSAVGTIEASRFDARTAYAAIDRHRLDDVAPHVLRTNDDGRTWTSIVAGIPDGAYVHVVREDPARRGLLYAGTELGVFVSFDDGGRWHSLQRNLPTCSVRDIALHRGDLVIATHGRSFWVMDDVSSLAQWNEDVAGSAAWLFAARRAVRVHPAGFQGTPEPKDEPAGENPPEGAALDYWLAPGATAPVTLEILDSRGEPVRRFASTDAAPAPDLHKIVTTPDWVAVDAPLAATPGLHRVVWNLRYAVPKELTGLARFANAAVWAPPGRYTVRLTAGGRTMTQPLEIARDPRIAASDADLTAQFALAREVESLRVEIARALVQAASLRRAIAARQDSGAAADVRTMSRKIDEVAGAPGDVRPEEFWADEGMDSLRKLSTALLRFAVSIESADSAPSPDVVAGFRHRRETARRTLEEWTALTSSEPARSLLENAPPSPPRQR
jgi:photosystem II stability/assembly factor-like uncharacterized protein